MPVQPLIVTHLSCFAESRVNIYSVNPLALANVLPSDVWLTQLTASAPVSSAAATTTAVPTTSANTPATGFLLQGYTYSHDAVARFLSRLALVPDLKDIQLSSSVASSIRGRQIVQFQIGGNVSSVGTGQ